MDVLFCLKSNKLLKTSYCFCGHYFGRNGVSTSCTVSCNGDSSQICGNTVKNSVYKTSSKQIVTFNKTIGNLYLKSFFLNGKYLIFVSKNPKKENNLNTSSLFYVGCFADNYPYRDLSYYYSTTVFLMTIDYCFQMCLKLKYSLAGLQAGYFFSFESIEKKFLRKIIKIEDLSVFVVIRLMVDLVWPQIVKQIVPAILINNVAHQTQIASTKHH